MFNENMFNRWRRQTLFFGWHQLQNKFRCQKCTNNFIQVICSFFIYYASIRSFFLNKKKHKNTLNLAICQSLTCKMPFVSVCKLFTTGLEFMSINEWAFIKYGSCLSYHFSFRLKIVFCLVSEMHSICGKSDATTKECPMNEIHFSILLAQLFYYHLRDSQHDARTEVTSTFDIPRDFSFRFLFCLLYE